MNTPNELNKPLPVDAAKAPAQDEAALAADMDELEAEFEEAGEADFD